MIKIIKSNKAITLMALTIYISIFILIIGVITAIGTNFFGQLGKISETQQYATEFNKFAMFFIADIKQYEKAIISDDKLSIKFDDNLEYTVKDNCIYRNDTQIAKNIISCNFTSKEYIVNNITKNIINVDLKIGKNKSVLEENIDFTLKYW